jgi:hypothetical protein
MQRRVKGRNCIGALSAAGRPPDVCVDNVDLLNMMAEPNPVGGVRRGATAESAKRRLTPPTKEEQRPDRHVSINITPWTPLYIPVVLPVL